MAKKRSIHEPPLKDWQVHYLLTGKDPEYEKPSFNHKLASDSWDWSDGEATVAWEKNKKWILKDFIRKHPGRRPFAWWCSDAPRWTKKLNNFLDGKLPAPRRRIGGTGTPCYEVLAHAPSFNFGLPVEFVSKFLEDYYNGRQNFDNDPFMKARYHYKEGDFKGVAIDPNDPPTFEAEATYLKRHKLLSKSEEKRLKPADFEPEAVL